MRAYVSGRCHSIRHPPSATSSATKYQAPTPPVRRKSTTLNPAVRREPHRRRTAPNSSGGMATASSQEPSTNDRVRSSPVTVNNDEAKSASTWYFSGSPSARGRFQPRLSPWANDPA